MHPATRGAILGSVVGIAAYVTGIQKKVISPILKWYGKQATGIQLVILLALLAGIAGLLLWRAWRARRDLRASQALAQQWQPSPGPA